MAITPTSTQPSTALQQLSNLKKLKKSDGDGDEVNGADPKNEKSDGVAKIATQQKQPATGVNAPAGGVGANLNKTA